MIVALLLLGQASLTAIGEPAPAMTGPSGRWAILRIEPSFARAHTEIAIGTLRYDLEKRRLDYWMRREERDRRRASLTISWADSRACPAMRAAIEAMSDLGAMKIDPPRANDNIIVTADGTLYTLEAPGRYNGGHTGTLLIRVNVGTPLASWAERTQSEISDCWSNKPPSADN